MFREKINQSCSAAWAAMLRFLTRIRKDIRQHPGKALLTIVLLPILWYVCPSPLSVLLVWMAACSLAYDVKTGIFFLCGLTFLLMTPVFFMLQNQPTAEQFATAAYALLVTGIVIELLHYIQKTYREQHPSFRELMRQGGISLRAGVVVAALILNVGGLYFIKKSTDREIAADHALIMRLGGSALEAKDQETEQLKSEMNGLLEKLATATDNKIATASFTATTTATTTEWTDSRTTTPSMVLPATVDILNASGKPGAAARLKAILTAAGYLVKAIGNAPQPQSGTTIFYTRDHLTSAKQLQALLQTPASLEPTQDVPFELRIVIGRK